MLKCGDCEKIFVGKGFFERHEAKKLFIRTTYKKEDVKCNKCNIIYLFIEALPRTPLLLKMW